MNFNFQIITKSTSTYDLSDFINTLELQSEIEDQVISKLLNNVVSTIDSDEIEWEYLSYVYSHNNSQIYLKSDVTIWYANKSNYDKFMSTFNKLSSNYLDNYYSESTKNKFKFTILDLGIE